MKLLITIFLFFNVAWAIDCSHPSLTLLVEQLYRDNGQNVKCNLPVVVEGDPHHYEATNSDLKKLITSKLLVVAPIELHPWLSGVLKKRSKASTVLLTVPQDVYTLYNKADLHDLAHFWIYPEAICDMQKQLFKKLSQLDKSLLKPSKCSLEVPELKKLKKKLAGRTVVLSHEAFVPYLLKNGIKAMSIKESGHHGHVSHHKVKDISKMKGDFIFLKEKNIYLQDKILKVLSEGKIVPFSLLEFSGKDLIDNMNQILKQIHE